MASSLPIHNTRLFPQSYLLGNNNNNKTVVLLLFLFLKEVKDSPHFKQGVYVIHLAESWERVVVKPATCFAFGTVLFLIIFSEAVTVTSIH